MCRGRDSVSRTKPVESARAAWSRLPWLLASTFQGKSRMRFPRWAKDIGCEAEFSLAARATMGAATEAVVSAAGNYRGGRRSTRHARSLGASSPVMKDSGKAQPAHASVSRRRRRSAQRASLTVSFTVCIRSAAAPLQHAWASQHAR